MIQYFLFIWYPGRNSYVCVKSPTISGSHFTLIASASPASFNPSFSLDIPVLFRTVFLHIQNFLAIHCFTSEFKSSVENAVSILEKGFFHKLGERKYFSLEQFNKDLWNELEALNKEPFKKKEHNRYYY